MKKEAGNEPEHLRRRETHRRDNRLKGMALFLILFEISKQCVSQPVGVPAGQYLPLELCSFAEYAILIDAFCPRNRFGEQLLAFASYTPLRESSQVPERPENRTIFRPFVFFQDFRRHKLIGLISLPVTASNKHQTGKRAFPPAFSPFQPPSQSTFATLNSLCRPLHREDLSNKQASRHFPRCY